MPPPEPRHPGQVPDLPALDVRAGHDTDGDGVPDTALTVAGADLLVHVDLDGDLFADQLLRIGPDGAVQQLPAPEPPAGTGAVDGLLGGAAAGTP